MFDQFFGKPFWITLGSLAGVFVVSMIVFFIPFLAAFALLVIGLATAVVSWRRPEFGIAIAFAELFANSHGHLISYQVGGFGLSLRMVVFAAVMVAWIMSVASRRSGFSFRDVRFAPFLPLFAAVILGFMVGFLQNDPFMAFKDGNGYLYVAYLFPILSVEWNGVKRRLLFQVVAAAAVWVVVLTLGLLYVFTHFPEWMLGPAYRFIRDTRTGELTKMAGNIFRIFLQAQLSVVFFLFVVAPFLLVRTMACRTWWRFTLGLTALVSVVLISLSRSFWLGIFAGVVALFALIRMDAWPGFRAAGRAVWSGVAATFLAAILLIGVVLFPLPYRVGSVGDLTGLFSERATDLSDVAISSRWNLLPPLLEEITSTPFFGAGFGEEVTFKTDDPRARAINPDGTWTTYALEWGWLELWLKMGVLGPIAFFALFVGLARGLWPYMKTDQSWIAIAFLSSLVMLYATHAFSPYLNHPLGIGMLLFFVPFLKSKPSTQGSKVPVLDEVRTRVSAQASTAPSMSE